MLSGKRKNKRLPLQNHKCPDLIFPQPPQAPEYDEFIGPFLKVINDLRPILKNNFNTFPSVTCSMRNSHRRPKVKMTT